MNFKREILKWKQILIEHHFISQNTYMQTIILFLWTLYMEWKIKWLLCEIILK